MHNEDVVHWERNTFNGPLGNVGKNFVQELKLFRGYTEDSPLQGIAMKAYIVMSIVLLQKPHQKAKNKECNMLRKKTCLMAKG